MKFPLILFFFIPLLSGCASVTPLMKAADKGDAPAVQALLGKGAVVNARDSYGCTALMRAAYLGQTATVKLLLQQGADPKLRSVPLEAMASITLANPGWTDSEIPQIMGGRTALGLAAEKGHADIVRLLLTKSEKADAMHSLVAALLKRTGHADVVSVLLDSAADINSISGDLDFDSHWLFGENTMVNPLSLAAMSGQRDIVELLLNKGADVNYRNGADRCALDIAAENGYAGIVRLLLEHGANTNIDMALEMAGKNGHAAIVKLLEQFVRQGSAQTVQPPARSSKPGARSSPVASDVDNPDQHLAEVPDDFALVVGIEGYSNELPAAQFAEHDAAAVRNHLLALGFPQRNIKFLTGQRATLSGLASYLEDWLPRNVKEDSRVFFYFSGHGAPSPESGQAYLVPWDGDPNFLDKTAYPVKKLYADLNALKAKQIIVALDSCFSGAGGRSVLAKGIRPLVNKVDMDVSAGGKLVLFAAAAAKETTSTLDDQGHGLFTYYFLKGLGGAARDNSGAITPRGLYDYLKPKVQDAASRQNRDQTPVLEGATNAEITRFK